MYGATGEIAVGMRNRTDDLKDPAISSKPNGAKRLLKQTSTRRLPAKAHGSTTVPSNKIHVSQCPNIEEVREKRITGLEKPTVHSLSEDCKPGENCGGNLSNMAINQPIIYTQMPLPDLVSVPRFIAFGWDAYPTRARINEICRKFQRRDCSYGENCSRIHPKHWAGKPSLVDPVVKIPCQQPTSAALVARAMIQEPTPPAPVARLATQQSSPPTSVAKPSVQQFTTLGDKESVSTVSAVSYPTRTPCESDRAIIAQLAQSNIPLRYHPHHGIGLFTDKVDPQTVCTNDESTPDGNDFTLANLSSDSSSGSSILGDETTNRDEPRPPPSSTVLCRAWLMKQCDRGYDCPHVHGNLNYDRPIHAKYPSPRSRYMCLKWKNKSCWHGYLCNYMHGDLDYDKPTTIHSYEGTNKTSSFAPPDGKDRRISLWQGEQAENVVEKPSPPPSAHYCKNWLRKRCTYGANCKFVHGDIEYDPPVKGIYAPPLYSETCRLWELEDCNLGYACLFTHPDLEYGTPPPKIAQLPAPRDKIPPIGQRPLPQFPFTCQEWVRKRCRKGYHCHYIHGDLEYDEKPPMTTAAATPTPGPVNTLAVGPVNDPPVGKRPLPKISETCIKWLRGRCDLRYACIRRHNDLEYDPPVISQSVVASKTQTSVEPRTWTVKVHDHAKIELGPGFQVQRIETGFETRWLYLDNVPVSTTSEDVLQLLRPFGEVLDVKIPAHVNSSYMLVRARFSSAAEARQASTSLHGADALGGKISARLPMHEASGLKATLQDTAARIRWEAPGKLAYCGYSNMEHAQQGIAATQKPFRDRYIQASEHIGVPAVGIVTVCFRGLPLDATKEDMAWFGKPDDVVWMRPNYQNLMYAEDRIKRILGEGMELLQFVLQPPPYKDGGMAQAWAYFPTPRDAKAVCGRLHGRKPAFTGRTKIFAQHVQSLSLSVPHHIYQKLSSDIKALCATAHLERRCIMNVLERPAPSPTLIKVSGDDLKEIGQLKVEIEKVLNWETLRQGANIAWDPFFAYPAGMSFIQNLERDYPSVSIRVDIPRRSIRLLGSSQSRAAVREMILSKMTELSLQQMHWIILPGPVLGVFLRSKLAEFEDQFGRENVSLDLCGRRLVIRGDNATYRTAREAVRRISQEHLRSDHPRAMAACPVCFEEVVNPVKLPCGHSWCQDCLSRYLMSSTDNKSFPLTCLGDEGKCSDHIPLVVARKVLTIPEFDAVVDAAFIAHVQSHPREFHYCPTPDCPQVYRHAPRDTVLQCPSCLLRICPSCHVEAHDGFACPDPEADNNLFREWTKGHDVKPCPECKILIERAEGCNHMTCTQCRTHICWVCLQTFPGGDGIYDHMRAEHGGIGLLED